MVYGYSCATACPSSPLTISPTSSDASAGGMHTSIILNRLPTRVSLAPAVEVAKPGPNSPTSRPIAEKSTAFESISRLTISSFVIASAPAALEGMQPLVDTNRHSPDAQWLRTQDDPFGRLWQRQSRIAGAGYGRNCQLTASRQRGTPLLPASRRTFPS